MKGNIPDFDCYHVTREGNVYSKYRDRVTWRKMAKRKKNNGYLIVSLRNNKGIKYTFNIHRLVALIYIPTQIINRVWVIRIIIEKIIK